MDGDDHCDDDDDYHDFPHDFLNENIKTSKRRFEGTFPCLRESVTDENFCKKRDINCISGGVEIEKVMRERPDP